MCARLNITDIGCIYVATFYSLHSLFSEKVKQLLLCFSWEKGMKSMEQCVSDIVECNPLMFTVVVFLQVN